MLLVAQTATGQVTQVRPRRQFITIDIERGRTMPLHFKENPLQQLAGRELGVDADRAHDYRSSDGTTTVDVQDFRRSIHGVGLSVYPFGTSSSSSLMLRAAYETLPVIRLRINGPAGTTAYSLADGRAYDFGLGVISSDTPAGWSMGAHSFAGGGAGLIRSERGDGQRLFAEAGGGVTFGPIGVQVGLKIAYNRLTDPRPHHFYTVPLTLRGTVSF